MVQQELSLTPQPVDRREHRPRRLSAALRPRRLRAPARDARASRRWLGLDERPTRPSDDLPLGRAPDGRDRQGAVPSSRASSSWTSRRRRCRRTNVADLDRSSLVVLRDRGRRHPLHLASPRTRSCAFCDHVTVLKDGSVTADRRLAGRRRRRPGAPDGRTRPRRPLSALRLARVRRSRPETKRFRAGGAVDVDFELHRGEILGSAASSVMVRRTS